MSRAFLARCGGFILLAIATACHRRTPAVNVPVAAAPMPVSTEPHAAPAEMPANEPQPTATADRAPEAERTARARALLAATVYFRFDRAELDAAARQALDAKIEVLNAEPSYQLTIEGHADDRGSDTYNIALAMRRAGVVRRYLSTRGVSEMRLAVVSFGEERPTCTSAVEACWQKNRRAEFSVSP